MTRHAELDAQSRPMFLSAARWARWASYGVILVSLLIIVRQLPIETAVARLSSMVEGAGWWGPLLFAVAYVVAALLFVPGSALTLAAGAVFGLLKGTAIVSVASTTAAALALLIARYLARNAVEAKARGNARFAAVDRAVAQGGWRIVALLRLSPAVPFSIGNYLFGLTAVRFLPYVVASWIAMLPGTFAYVYLGVVGRAGLAAGAGESAGRTPLEWAVLVVGLLATIAVTVYVTRLARRAIAKATDIERPRSEPASHPAKGWTMSTFITVLAALLLAATATLASIKQSLIKGLFGPPIVTLSEAYDAKPGGPSVDHSAFGALLQEHVAPGGWVDYAALRNDAARLDGYITQLANVPFDQLGRDEKLATLINAYNAFTLRLILDYYPLDSIKDIPGEKRWDDRRWNIGGRLLSLNQIEHEEIRPNFKEPRIHFALVCAAIGCPPLRGEAYTADRLEEQLHDQAVYVHTQNRWYRFDPEANRLQLTALYDWYGSDFTQVAPTITAYAAKYDQALAEALSAGRNPEVEFLNYDWKLNTSGKAQ